MISAVLPWARIHRGPPARGRRERFLRPIKPLPAEVVAYSRAIRAILQRVEEKTTSSLLPYMNHAKAHGLIDAQVEDDVADVLRAIFELLRRSVSGMVADMAALAANRWRRSADKRHRERFYKEVEETLGIDVAQIVREEKLGPVLKMKTQENVSLITSISAEYLEKVERAVYQHVIHGQPGQKSLAQKIQEIGDVSARRAKFIARDQTAKLVSAMNKERNLAIGLETYKWITSHDERVRPTHRRLDGKTFRWDDPPAVGNPGEDYNCRCTASPIVEF